MANVGLYNVPEVDITYENIPWFQSMSAQQNWMDKRLRKSIDAKISVDPTRTSITISQPYAEVERWNVDYVCIFDQSGKRLYYFVTDYEYKTSNATTLVLEIDVFQTYMFDFRFNPSFVDRAHTPRWNGNIPACPVLDEGIQFGDLVVGESETNKFRDKYIIASTSPLGRTKFKPKVPPTASKPQDNDNQRPDIGENGDNPIVPDDLENIPGRPKPNKEVPKYNVIRRYPTK